MSPLEKLERVSLGVAIGGGVLSLASAGGCSLLATPNTGWTWFLHPLVFLLSAAAGVVTMLRGVEIDRRRWEIVDEPLLTSGEREHAHKEAERQRRHAGTLLLLGPLMVGFWLSQEYRSAGLGRLATDLLSVAGLFGFFAGILYGRRYEP